MTTAIIFNYFTHLSLSCLLLAFIYPNDALAFVPFQDTPALPTPWSPLAHFPADEYWNLKERQRSHFSPGMSGIITEAGYKCLFQTLGLLSAHKQKSMFGPSGAWAALIGGTLNGFGIGPDVGLLFDDLFLTLIHPSPSIEWYIQLYAARDTLYTHWIQNPRLHTKCMTIILALLCNALAAVHIRLLSLRDGAGRRTAANLTAALPIEWQELLGRPGRPLDESRHLHTFEFLRLQLEGTTGNLPAHDHPVYLMLADDRPYVGKIGVTRKSTQLAGIAPR